VSFQGLKRGIAVGLLLVSGAATATMFAPNAWSQEEGTRKAKSKVQPTYPELARRMKISGVVKVQVTVAANGTVKDAKLLGGHPVLANAVLDAVKKWRYETAPQETTENLQFRFDPAE
jgi:TonB family protein